MTAEPSDIQATHILFCLEMDTFTGHAFVGMIVTRDYVFR